MEASLGVPVPPVPAGLDHDRALADLIVRYERVSASGSTAMITFRGDASA